MKIFYDYSIFIHQNLGGISRYFVNLEKELSNTQQTRILAPIHKNFFLKKNNYKNKYFNAGIKVAKIDELIKNSVGLKSTDGMFVIDIVNKSTGERAGIKIGDIILSINNKKIDTWNSLSRVIGAEVDRRSAKMIELQILRDSNYLELKVLIEWHFLPSVEKSTILKSNNE